LSIIDSKVYGIETLPEAKNGFVKRMPKREMRSCELHIPHKERTSRIVPQKAARVSVFSVLILRYPWHGQFLALGAFCGGSAHPRTDPSFALLVVP
jgi:hypothetical protein